MFKRNKEKGTTLENAVKIKGAKNTMEGIYLEHKFIDKALKPSGEKWDVISQKLIKQNNCKYDKISIRTENGAEMHFYFDITKFFGKF